KAHLRPPDAWADRPRADLHCRADARAAQGPSPDRLGPPQPSRSIRGEGGGGGGGGRAASRRPAARKKSVGQGVWKTSRTCRRPADAALTSSTRACTWWIGSGTPRQTQTGWEVGGRRSSDTRAPPALRLISSAEVTM